MDQRLKQYFSIKLHYKNGVAKVAFHDETVFGDIHSYEKTAANLYEVFILYKAYERFVAKKGWHLAAAHLAGFYGISIEGKSFTQVVNEIGIAQQKELERMETNEKH